MGNVYLYVHDLRSSGVVRNAMSFARRFADEHPTILVAGYDQGFFREEARGGPFELVLLGRKAGVFPRLAAALRLRRWLRTQPPGVLMSVGNMGHPTPYLASRGLRHIRRIYRISNGIVRDDGLRSAIRLRWMAMLARDATRIALVGRALGTTGPFAPALRSGRAVEIPNGVDRTRALALARCPTPHPWLDEATPTIVAVGRLRPQKNFDLLIEAVGRLHRHHPVRLILIGGGMREERERLGRLAKEAGIAEDFLLAGETDNVFSWLSRASCSALVSRWEGSSLALLEAMAVGTPVVASRLAGDAAEVLGEGRYGLLFDGVDPEALASALRRQISHEAVRPGDRAEAYAVRATAAAYASLIAEAEQGAAAARA